MRTTVDLPDPLIRAAKARAALRGESLKDLFERALATELGRSPSQPVTFPLIRSNRPPIPEEEIARRAEAVEQAEDLDRVFG